MSEQEFEAYLRLMSRFLRLNESQRGAIGRELRGHMEERLEDLIDRGYRREDAVNTILDEFGDAAALAGEFGRVGTRRKWIMRTTAGTVGIAAAVLLVSFLLPENRPLPSPAQTYAAREGGPMAENAGPAVMPTRVGVPVRAGLMVGMQSESASDRRTREKLSQTTAINFPEGTAFDEVLNFLRDQGDLSIAVNWNALAVLGIDRSTDTLGMNLKDVKLETVLNMLLENVGGPEAAIGYAIVDGIVRISTGEQLDRNTAVRVYDVADLIHRDLVERLSEIGVDASTAGAPGGFLSPAAPAAGGPGMGMPFGGTRGGGMGGGYGGGAAPTDEAAQTQAMIREIEAQRVQALEQLIRTTIQRGTWSPEGALGSMSYYEGLLVVDHTARAHQELAELLAVMRQVLAARPKEPAGKQGPGGGFGGMLPGAGEGGGMHGMSGAAPGGGFGSTGGAAPGSAYNVRPEDTLAGAAREHYGSPGSMLGRPMGGTGRSSGPSTRPEDVTR